MEAHTSVSECPGCGHRLYLDYNLLCWTCTNPKCKKTYKYEELPGISLESWNETKQGSERHDWKARSGDYKLREPGEYSESKPSDSSPPGYRTHYQPHKRTRRTPKIIGIALSSIFAIVMLIVITDPFTPLLSANALSFSFTVYDGLNPPAQTLSIETNRGAITWTATAEAQWLDLDPANGNTDEETTMTLSVDISDMYPGEYAAIITIDAPAAKNKLPDIPVSIVITETKETLAIKTAVLGNTTNTEVHYDTQSPFLNLINNQTATNPTWRQLLHFLASDDTDTRAYVEDVYVCRDFARTLHNNAEQAGIRAAWVGIHFEDSAIGHALNAFNTIDEGIVFVDCTNGGFDVFVPSLGDSRSHETGCDRIAYVRIGEDYGAVSAEVAESPQYAFYQRYEQRWEHYGSRLEEYDTRVEEYNRRVEEYIAGVERYIDIVYRGTYDYATTQTMYLALKGEEEDLEREEEYLKQERSSLLLLLQDLGYYPWESLGVVSHVEIYW